MFKREVLVRSEFLFSNSLIGKTKRKQFLILVQDLNYLNIKKFHFIQLTYEAFQDRLGGMQRPVLILENAKLRDAVCLPWLNNTEFNGTKDSKLVAGKLSSFPSATPNHPTFPFFSLGSHRQDTNYFRKPHNPAYCTGVLAVKVLKTAAHKSPDS